ncbi:phage portal protein [Nocardioides sp. KC13]|uniref:Phage portal protein n=1 Tax=Nocardioides turkmenicus TaxID=2711220 RepID=A0A6M1R1U4_9ACTN|nr:phage portal protein [Nocardioides sp. KC13]NGN92651.1 phage portal protein [Nocardioides sp. KC13]
MRRISDRLAAGKAIQLAAASTALESAQFAAIGPESIPASFFGLSAYSDPVAVEAPVSRRSALQVPAIKRARDLVPGTLGTLPVDLYGPQNTLSYSELLAQPERNTPRSVTMAKTYEDLWFEGVAWWYITEFGWHGYPTKVRRLEPRTVDVRIDGKVYVTQDGNQGMTWEYAPDARLIRFDSPTEAVLTAGARAIRASLTLDAAALRYADGSPMADYFEPSDGYDPDQDEVDAALDQWLAARHQRSTGYVPAGFDYHLNPFDAQKLQLAEARQHAVLELSRVTGVDPEDLAVSTTSRTYQNSQDRYQARIKDTLRPFMVAVEERLSMNDVCPRGYDARTRVAELLRADDKTRFESYKLGLEVGAIGQDEIRDLEHKAPLTQPPALPAPSSEEAQDA